MTLTTHETHELDEADLGCDLQLDLFVQAFELPVVDEHEEAVLLECLDGAAVLFFPVELSPLAQPVAVEHALGFDGLDEAAEVLRRGEVVLLHLLEDAAADQLSGRDAGGEE